MSWQPGLLGMPSAKAEEEGLEATVEQDNKARPRRRPTEIEDWGGIIVDSHSICFGIQIVEGVFVPNVWTNSL